MKCYFKLFHSIKDEHEAAEFARLELESLMGPVETVRNFADVVTKPPLSYFTNQDVRIQDVMLHEVPYGNIHGYEAEVAEVDLPTLQRRLAYTQGIYIVGRDDEPNMKSTIAAMKTRIGKTAELRRSNGFSLLWAVTYQYFLEKSQYISRLSRNSREVDINVATLLRHPFENIYRVPASATMRVGKRLEDYFAIREEPSLHLTHYMHPYKGKFHPKMARALLNIVCPSDRREDGDHVLVMDNFAGSGTLLVEATMMGLDSIGVEINPLSVLMSNVKCQCLAIPAANLKAAIDSFMEQLGSEMHALRASRTAQRSLFRGSLELGGLEKKAEALLLKFSNNKNLHQLKAHAVFILAANTLLSRWAASPVRDFLLLGLSGAISDVARRTKRSFTQVLQERLFDLYLRVYLFQKLNETLELNLGKSKTFVGDTRDMAMIESDSIDGIVNSPPYSTALDYIKNDYPQLTLLELVPSLKEVSENMIGIPKTPARRQLTSAQLDALLSEGNMPLQAQEVVRRLIQGDRADAALRSYLFFKDMRETCQEMKRVLRPGAACAVVIGNNHFLVKGRYFEVPNDEVFAALGQQVGLELDKQIRRPLQKTRAGNIRYESVVILRKPDSIA